MFRVFLSHTSGWQIVVTTVNSQSKAEFAVRQLNKPLPLSSGDVAVLNSGFTANFERCGPDSEDDE